MMTVMAAWWLSVSSLRALCAWTREYLVINFLKVVGFFYFYFFNLTKIIPTWAQRMGGLWAVERRSRPAGCWWKLCNCEMMQHEKTRDEDPPSATHRWFSMIHLLSLVLWASQLWTCDRVRSLQLLPLQPVVMSPCGMWSINDFL